MFVFSCGLWAEDAGEVNEGDLEAAGGPVLTDMAAADMLGTSTWKMESQETEGEWKAASSWGSRRPCNATRTSKCLIARWTRRGESSAASGIQRQQDLCRER